MADDVEVKFGASASGVTAAAQQVKGQFAELTASSDMLAGAFGKISMATSLLGTGLGLVGLDSFVRGMAESGVEALRLTAALGISGHQMLDLKAAAALSGVGIQELATSLERMSLQIQRSTRDAFTPQAQALKVLGINSKELIGLSADQYFNKITEAASRFNPSLNLTNALMAIGGRSMANMVAAFTQGTDRVRQFQEEMQRTKIGQEGFYAAAADTHHQLLLMDSAVDGLNKQLFLALKPTLDIIIRQTKAFAEEVRTSIKEGGGWSLIVDGIVTSMKAFVQIINLTSASMAAFFVIAKEGWKFLLDGEYTFDKLRERAGALAKALEDIGAVQLKKFKELWKDTADEMKKHPLGEGLDAGAIDQNGRQALEMTMKSIDGQIAAVEQGFERRRLLYEQDVMALRITEDQKVRLTGVASQERFGAEIALLQQKLQLGGLDIAQRQDIENKITELVLKANNDRLRSQLDYTRTVQAQWTSILGTIQNSWDSQLRGILTGTVTWKQGMKNVFVDLVLAAISEFEKLAIVKPMIAALSDAFAPAELFSNIIKIIMKMVGQVFTGATAFFAPTLGPAAPAAGAAVAAATEATALSYDTGSWSVPQTANALVHRDEMILPVDFASAVRSALTGGAMGGGSSMNLNIQAWDGASVARWLRTGGAGLLARAVSAQYNQNPTIRPSY